MSEVKKFKILVAEDNNINIQVAKYILTPIASELDFVMNGEDAVSHFSAKEYDFILMDVKMPIMDGYEATGKIRQIESEKADGKRIPIIAMTANNLYEEIQVCMQAGMDGFLSKPFNAGDVQNVLKTIEEPLDNNN
jgi:CheY-like chemotaxis protein